MRLLSATSILLTLFSTGLSAPGEEPSPKTEQAAAPVSESRIARCLIEIAQDSDAMSAKVAEAMLEGSDVFVDYAIREVLGDQTAPRGAIFVRFDMITLEARGGRYDLAGWLTVSIEDDADLPPVARELLASIRARIEEELVGEYVSYRRELEKRLVAAEQQLEEANERLRNVRELRRELIGVAGMVELSRDRILDRVAQLEGQKRDVEMEAISLEARARALQEQIAQIGKRITSAADNEIAEELDRVAALRAAELARLQKLDEAGQTSRSELERAQEAMSRTRIELLSHRQAAAERNGGDLLKGFNADLAAASIELAGVQARLQRITKELDEVRSGHLLDLADRYEKEVEAPWRAVSHATEKALAQVEELRQELRTLRDPTINVIGGTE